MSKYQFQQVHGQHIGIDPSTGRERKYLQGETIDTDIDLGAKFNTPGLPPKFVGTNQGLTAPKPKIVDLGTMTVLQLVAFAEEHSIALSGAETSAEMLVIIREALSA